MKVKPIYAEFDDGTRFGRDADLVHECLVKDRLRVLAAQEKALDEYLMGGESALFQQIQSNRDLAWLGLVKGEGGFPAVLDALRRQRRLAP